ncbi:MAG: hypothetical protein PVI23_11995 [Maricaulaceae bacterium]|jgi:hypothetical protein
MTTEQPSVQADLAFLRALAEGDGRLEPNFAKAMLSGGLIYGLQCLVHLADSAGVISFPPSVAFYLFVTIAPTIVWLAYLVWIGRRAPQQAPAGSRRAINAVFQSIGLVSVVVLPVTLFIAFRQNTVMLVFVHSMVVFAVLGAAWYVAFRLARRAWMLALSIGWLASAALLGVATAYSSFTGIFAVAAFALLILMALPGAIMLRGANSERAS